MIEILKLTFSLSFKLPLLDPADPGFSPLVNDIFSKFSLSSSSLGGFKINCLAVVLGSYLLLKWWVSWVMVRVVFKASLLEQGWGSSSSRSISFGLMSILSSEIGKQNHVKSMKNLKNVVTKFLAGVFGISFQESGSNAMQEGRISKRCPCS